MVPMPSVPKKGSSNWALKEEEREEEKLRASQRIGIDEGWNGSAIESLKKSDQEKGQGGKKRKEQVRDHDARRRVQPCLVGLSLGLLLIRDSGVEMPGGTAEKVYEF